MERRKLTDEVQTLDLVEKDFKITVLNMLKEVKGTMDKELNEILRMIYEQLDNINIEKL